MTGTKIYFVRSASGEGPIKIGMSLRPEGRLYEMQTGSPVKLEILLTCDGGRSEERLLHSHFKAHRLHREWFNPTPELLALVDGLRVESISLCTFFRDAGLFVGGQKQPFKIKNLTARSRVIRRGHSRRSLCAGVPLAW